MTDQQTPATPVFPPRHTPDCESCARPTTPSGRRILSQLHGWPDRMEYPWNLLDADDVLRIELEARATAQPAPTPIREDVLRWVFAQYATVPDHDPRSQVIVRGTADEAAAIIAHKYTQLDREYPATAQPAPGEAALLQEAIEHVLLTRAAGGLGYGFNADLHPDIAAVAILHDPAVRAALRGAPTPGGTGTTGAGLIAAERQRQTTEEGYTPEHDSGHGDELARAGAAYAISGSLPRGQSGSIQEALDLWPWEMEAWKPSDDPIRDLTKAGALIAAAIDSALSGASASSRSEPTE